MTTPKHPMTHCQHCGEFRGHGHVCTATPRTDACPYCGAGQLLPKYRYYCGTNSLLDRKASMETRTELCREREARQKAEAEVERLMEKGFDLVEEKLKLKSQLTKAEAEVERPRAHLSRAIEIAETFASCVALYQGQIKSAPEYAELDQLKANLNQDKK